MEAYSSLKVVVRALSIHLMAAQQQLPATPPQFWGHSSQVAHALAHEVLGERPQGSLNVSSNRCVHIDRPSYPHDQSPEEQG
jgi:hypothetical protein